MSKISTILLITLSLAGVISACTPKTPQLIEKLSGNGVMHGKEVLPSDPIAAGIVGIYNVKEQYICTGSLIAPNVVLTAAHCMEGKPTNLRIIFSVNIDEIMSAHELDVKIERTRVVTDYKVHPKWNPRDEDTIEDTGDIALLKFKGTVPAGYKEAQFLSDSSVLTVGAFVTVAGYGVSTIDTVTIDPKKYRNLDGAIESGEVYCDENKRNCMEVTMSGDGILRQTQAPIASVMKTELMLDERKAGTCSGDSGGPAYIEKDGQFYLFGITSRGTYFCDDSGVYTNALSYTKWIQDTMGSLK